MLQATLIGHLGGDAETKNSNGHEFTTFRVAHTDKWTGSDGVSHEQTQWVDCVLNGRPNVVPYLKRGTLVYVSGNLQARVYSSAKDRCMKAGVTINVARIELLGGRPDDVPSRLVTTDGVFVDVTKRFFCQSMVRQGNDAEYVLLMTPQGGRFVVDRAGWVMPFVENEEPNSTETNQTEQNSAETNQTEQS